MLGRYCVKEINADGQIVDFGKRMEMTVGNTLRRGMGDV